MAKRCGCASDECACRVVAGAGIEVTGAGSPGNPIRVTSTQADIVTGFNVQKDGGTVISNVHQLDLRGTAVTVTPGVDEAIVTVTVPDPTTGAIIPTGALFPFAGTSIPSGWLLCDGRTNLSVSTYPNLAGVLGN